MKVIYKTGRIEYVASDPVMDDDGIMKAVISSHEWPGIVHGSDGIDGMSLSHNRGITRVFYPIPAVINDHKTREILAGTFDHIGNFFGERLPTVAGDPAGGGPEPEMIR